MSNFTRKVKRENKKIEGLTCKEWAERLAKNKDYCTSFIDNYERPRNR